MSWKHPLMWFNLYCPSPPNTTGHEKHMKLLYENENLWPTYFLMPFAALMIKTTIQICSILPLKIRSRPLSRICNLIRILINKYIIMKWFLYLQISTVRLFFYTICDYDFDLLRNLEWFEYDQAQLKSKLENDYSHLVDDQM